MGSHKAYFVTTPIYYVNDAPHIGHAYTTIAGDVLTRWHRQAGEDVFFLTGTDEHGEKIVQAASAHDMSPQAWTDHIVETAFKPMLTTINAANDAFIRTTDEAHMRRAAEFWQHVKDAGYVYRGSYTGPYCVACEDFKTPAEMTDDERCLVHDTPVKYISEENYFFALSKFTDKLLAFYDEHPDFIEPAAARNEIVTFVRGGLQDISISRSTFDWGVPIPWDTSHVMYVWIDALLNYLTATGWPDEGFDRLWPADVHLVGRDILRFHSVIWPAMLMAADLPLPGKVFANGWLLVGGEKMSKTKLTGIAPKTITEVFGSDAYRYYFLREIAYGSDGSFSWESMAARYRAELGDQYGNLASRLTAMVVKYRGGALPDPCSEPRLEEALTNAVAVADARVRALDFQGGLEAIFEFIREVNGYVTETEPWKIAKDPQRSADLDRVLYATAESLRAVAVLLNAFMPKSSLRLWDDLGAAQTLGALAEQRVADAGRWGQLPAGAPISKGDALFPRIEDPQ